MMPCKFAALDGSVRELDLDTVIDVILGFSGRRSEWTATVVYDPKSKSFVELRSSPQNYRGNSEEEAEEVSEQYMCDVFQLDQEQLGFVRRNPSQWVLINRR